MSIISDMANQLVRDIAKAERNGTTAKSRRRIRFQCLREVIREFYKHHPLCRCARVEYVGGPLDGKKTSPGKLDKLMAEHGNEDRGLEHYELVYLHRRLVPLEDGEKVRRESERKYRHGK